MSPKQCGRRRRRIQKIPEIEAYSPRIKFGGLFSNFTETTNIRLNGVDPDMEMKTLPLLPSRIIQGEKAIKKGRSLSRNSSHGA